MLGFFCKLWVTFNYCCARKPALQDKKKKQESVAFHGVSTATTVDFKLPW